MGVAVATVFLAAGTSVALTVVNNVTSAEHGVLSATATQSAAKGLNTATVTLQSDLTNGTSLPCSLTGQSNGGTGGTTQSYSVAITYYSSVNVAASPPTASGPITCTGGSLASSSGVAAVGMVDTASAGSTSRNATQKLSALFTVTSSAFAGGYGIYSDTGFSLTNSVSVNANTGTVFVNGPLQCNSGTVNGPLYVNDPSDANATSVGNPANNALYLTNGCTINGILDVNGDVGVNTSAPQVTGNALVNGSVSFNNTGPQFQANLSASGTVGPATSSYVKGTITQNTPVTLPTVTPFPIVTWNSSAWTGWTVDAYSGACGSMQNSNSTPTGVYAALANDIASGTATVLYTSCAIALPQNLVEQLSANLAIVDTATGGMTFNADTFESKTSQVHNVDLIVPSDPASPGTATLMSQATCGSNYEIQGLNQETFGTTTNPIDTLVYDPCTVSLTNNGVFTGQLVAGSFGSALTNELSFTYASVGAVPGTTNGQAGGLTPVDQYVMSSN
jgi:hypothetical protein